MDYSWLIESIAEGVTMLKEIETAMEIIDGTRDES